MIKNKQRGFSLIEVLVTMVILATGLLGLAGMQGNSLRNTESAYQRSQAVILANDILDRMRTNQAGVAAGAYNNITTTPATASKDCNTEECTGSEMATFDDAAWHTQLAQLLPSGNGTVTGTGANSMFTITIMWDDDRDGNGSDCSDLTCFSVSSRL